jgi:integrase
MVISLKEVAMQKGSIRINGKWWWLKVRENVMQDGQNIRKLMYYKLAPVSQYRPSSNGEPPPTVKMLADEKLAPINLGKRDGLSADSLRSYLESYLKLGTGVDGRPVRKVSLKARRRDFKVIAGLLPDIQLRNVRTPDINRLFKSLIVADGVDMRSTSAYRNVRNFLSGAFRAAVGEGLMDFNPVRDAMVVRGNDPDTYAYSLSEVKQLMAVLKDDGQEWKRTMRAAFMVAAFTGLRLEEIKGLRWEDYDRHNQILNIRRTVVNHVIVEATKTKASNAPVAVVKTVAKELEAHLKRNSGDGFIFHKTNPQAPIIFETIILQNVQPACQAAGITFPVQMHCFRRGLDTWMKNAGIDISLRTNIMRHSPRNVTDRHYGRASIKQMRLVLKGIEVAYKRTKITPPSS